MSLELAGLLIGAAFVIAGLVIAVRRLRGIDWRRVGREAPNYFYSAWEAERSHFAGSCMTATAGVAVLLVLRLIVGPLQDRGFGVEVIVVGAGLTIALGALLFLASVGDLIWHLISGNVYEPGLDVVHEQKALGDAAYADESKIHEALTADAGFLEPTFED